MVNSLLRFSFCFFFFIFSTKELSVILGIAILKMEDYSYIQGYVNQMEEFAKAILDETAIMKATLNEVKTIAEVN